MYRASPAGTKDAQGTQTIRIHGCAHPPLRCSCLQGPAARAVDSARHRTVITCLQARRTTTAPTTTTTTTNTHLHALHATRSVRVLLHMLVIVWLRHAVVCALSTSIVFMCAAFSAIAYRSTQQAGRRLWCPITRIPPCCSTGGCWRGRSHGRCRLDPKAFENFTSPGGKTLGQKNQ